ncbi:hypothetical protein DY000_02025895 [Brassica cretica]|uniref:Uncharacterized protein n=1 Tax=Brassica cretica TaxID=69181 RepID=A0ABQ7E823_BRACR|nr:hypothetical protein DY000_02025895 [Brassica cretica]
MWSQRDAPCARSTLRSHVPNPGQRAYQREETDRGAAKEKTREGREAPPDTGERAVTRLSF